MGVPRVSMDYHFMSKKDEEAKNNPILVMVSEKTKDKYARATGRKGVGTAGEMDWLIQDMVEELKAWILEASNEVVQQAEPAPATDDKGSTGQMMDKPSAQYSTPPAGPQPSPAPLPQPRELRALTQAKSSFE